MPWGNYAIDGIETYAPDEETWGELVTGEALSGEQKRSPYREHTWTRQVGDACDLDGGTDDWMAYDNTVLGSITTRTYKGIMDAFTTYTDAICKTVNVRKRRGVGNEIVAVFWIRTGSGS